MSQPNEKVLLRVKLPRLLAWMVLLLARRLRKARAE